MLNEPTLSRGQVLQRNKREREFVSLVEILGSREEVCDSEDGLTGKNEAKMRENLSTNDRAKSICKISWREKGETWLGHKPCTIRSPSKVSFLAESENRSLSHYSNRTCVWPRSACVYFTTDRKVLVAYGLKTSHSVSDSEKSKSSNE